MLIDVKGAQTREWRSIIRPPRAACGIHSTQRLDERRPRDVVGPGGQAIKHVAPCQTGAGNGTAVSPWRTIALAMTSLNPGEVAYVHDGPAAVDYTESNLTPARDGTGPSSRIRLMAAPGERPWIGKPPSVTTAQPILRLTRPWWLVDGLNVDAAGSCSARR